MKRSNPTRSVPHAAPEDKLPEEMVHSRAARRPEEFKAHRAGRKRKPAADAIVERMDRRGQTRERFEAQSSQVTPTRNRKARVEGATSGGSFPDRAAEERRAPRPPAILVLYPDLNDDVGPEAVYGQYPRGFIGKMLPWLRCRRDQVLHLCSGCLPRGEGIRVDIRAAARPDIRADVTRLPLADDSVAAVMCDPPYSPDYARRLYNVKYPRPSAILAEAARVVRPGGMIVFVHYITPAPADGTEFVKAWALSTGFDMPVRAVTLYQKRERDMFVEGAR